MKNCKIEFLYFLIIYLLLLSSCSQNNKIEVVEGISIDSVSIYMQQTNDTVEGVQNLVYANKALSYAKKAKPDTAQTQKIEKILRYKAGVFGKLKAYDSLIVTNNALLKIGLQKNDTATIASQHFILGYYHFVSQQKDSAFQHYKSSKELYFKLEDSSRIGECLTYMAIIQSDLGDYVGSDNSAILALNYLDENNIHYLTTVYNCIAISAKRQQDYLEAIYWYDKAIDITTNKLYKITYLNNKANVYRYLKQYDKSIDILSDLEKDTILNLDVRSKARVIDNLAYTKWRVNNEEDVLKDFLLAQNLRYEDRDFFGLITSYDHLSEYYQEKNKKIALEYAIKMYQMAIAQNRPQDQMIAIEKLVALENPTKAKIYYKRYIQLNDSIQQASQKAINKFVKLEYDSEKNREENLQLKISTSAKELEVQKEKTKNVFLFTSGSFIFAGLLFFIYYRKQKHQLEKRAEVYDTEKRIAKKIHDEVANNMVNIMNKVQYTENSKEKLLDDLEKVYLLTRNISHQNNTIETGEHFDTFLKLMLTSFNSDTTTVILKDIDKVTMCDITKEKQIELYRILQELMVNMRKHSKAKLTAITFKSDNHNYQINYSDNGIGCDLELLKLKNGLQNVETRIKSINGTIIFETALNKGFKAFIRFKK